MGNVTGALQTSQVGVQYVHNLRCLQYYNTWSHWS